MSKELPWFKFYASVWLLGDISDEQEKIQGQFIRVCAIYWDRSCDMTEQELGKKVHKTKLKGLEKLGFIEYKDGKVCIPFLDEQHVELSSKRAVRQATGSLGGKAKAKQSSSNATVKPEQPLSIKEGEVDVEGEEEEEEGKGKGEEEGEDKEEVKFNFKKSLLNYGFTDTLVNDWLMVRKAKKATNTETAYKSFIKVIEDCKDVDKNIILTKCVEKSWAGVERDWLENAGVIKQAPKPFIYR